MQPITDLPTIAKNLCACNDERASLQRELGRLEWGSQADRDRSRPREAIYHDLRACDEVVANLHDERCLAHFKRLDLQGVRRSGAGARRAPRSVVQARPRDTLSPCDKLPWAMNPC